MSKFPFPPAEVATVSGQVVPIAESDEILLRVEAAARRIGVSRAQMYRLIALGEVVSVKVGASRRVPVRCLNEFVDRLIADQA